MVDHRIIDRLKKIDALTASSNPHEAALAAEKMAELLLRHGLSMVDVRGPRRVRRAWGVDANFEEVKRRLGGGVRPWKRYLIVALAENSGGYAFQFSNWDFVIIAQHGTADAIWFLYDRVATQIEHLAREACEEAGDVPNRNHWITSFCTGCVSRVRERLAAMRRRVATGASTSALATLQGQAKAEAHRRYKLSSRSRRHSPVIDAKADAAGRRAGDSINFDEALGSGRRAITGPRRTD